MGKINSSYTVDNIIEKLPTSKNHFVAVLICALGFMFDSFDTYIIAYAMPLISKEWGLDPVAMGTLNSAGIWGMVFGGVVCGPLTDRVGRRLGLIWTILGFSLITGLAAFTTGVTQLLVIRFVGGLCLGGMVPCAASLISEIVNSKDRGRVTSLLPTLWPLGMFLAAITALFYVPTFNGWRGLFIIGAMPALLAFFAIRHVCESPRWLMHTGQPEKSKKVLSWLGAKKEDLDKLHVTPQTGKPVFVPISTLFKPPYRKRMLLTCGYYTFSYFGYYGFLLWLPTILASVYGMSLTKTFTYTAITGAMSMLGRMWALYSIERFGRKQLFIVGFGVASIVALLFCFLKDPEYLLYLLCAVVFFYEQGVQGTIVYTPELYPSTVRTTASGVSVACGRVSGALSSVVFGFFMSHGWYEGIYITMSVMFFIAAALVFFLGVETKGKTLAELNAA